MTEEINQGQSYDTQTANSGGTEFKHNPQDFMNLLEGETKPKGIQNTSVNRTVRNDDTLAMKEILERFHNAADQSVSRLDEKEIKRMSQKKVSVAREWKVIVNEGGEKETYYDVVNTSANKSYFSKIKTLEAADLIIEYLEQKKPLNSSHIYKILDLDETFRRNRADAIQFKNKWKRLVEKKMLGKADICEARYQKAKNLALDAKKQLKNM